jgi:hypothetical protein
VGASGAWTGHYVPAFLRRYPFAFARDARKGDLTLCIDEASPRCGSRSDGEPLFGDDGEASPYLKGMADLSTEWERAGRATARFCARLRELDLLRPSEIKFTETDGRKAATGGFSLVDRERLRALPAAVAGDLLATGAMEPIFAHLLSLGCVARLTRRLAPLTLRN